MRVQDCIQREQGENLENKSNLVALTSDERVYDAGREFCHLMAAMKGRPGTKPYRDAYRSCMAQVEEEYVACYQNCAKGN